MEDIAKFIQETQEFFSSLNGKDALSKLAETDGELKYALPFDELVLKYPIPNDIQLEKQGFDEDGAKQKIQLLEAGEFKDGASDVEANKENSLFTYINEQKFTPSYNSPFDYIKSDKTLYVEKDGGDNTYKSINDAIEASLPGDVIQIGGGVYEEPVVITKPIELRAESYVCIKSNKSDSIILNSSVAKVQGLTIQCDAPGDTYCLNVQSGFLEVTECKIESQSSGALRAGPNTRILAQSCKVVSSNNHTSLAANSRSVFVNCEFSWLAEPKEKQGRRSPEILIGEKATGIFVDCKYLNTIITFQSESQGMVKGSTCINGQSLEKITVLDKAQVLILECKFRNYDSTFISLCPESETIIQKCEFDNNMYCIGAENTKDFIITDSKFFYTNTKGHENTGKGTCFRVYENAKGSITNTTFEGFENAIQVESKCSIYISSCKFNNCTNAASAHNQYPNSYTELKIHGTQFNNNERALAFKNIHSHITSCSFKNSKKIDISISAPNDESGNSRSEVDIHDSEFKHEDYAIKVDLNAVLNLTGCVFTEKKCAVKCTDQTSVTFTRCSVSASDVAIYIAKSAKVKIVKSVIGGIYNAQNKIIQNCGRCIQIKDNADVTIDNTEIVNAGEGILITGGTLAMNNNSKVTKVSKGLIALENSLVTLSETSFGDIKKFQVQESCSISLAGKEQYPRLIADACKFHNPGMYAICAKLDAKVDAKIDEISKDWSEDKTFGISIKNCTFSVAMKEQGNSHSYLSFANTPNAMIYNCSFCGGALGIEAERVKTKLLISSCFFDGNKRTGAHLQECNDVIIENCHFKETLYGAIVNKCCGIASNCALECIKTSNFSLDNESNFQLNYITNQ